MSARPLLQTVATVPIPLNHPWNLPECRCLKMTPILSVFHSYPSRVSYSLHFCQGPRRQNGQDPRYKVERKPREEGSVTISLSMLTATPEVDLGMECVPFNPFH
jgi:hypothetical protein